MSDLDLDVAPEPPEPRGRVVAARYRRALVAGLVGDPGREARAKAATAHAASPPLVASASPSATKAPNTSNMPNVPTAPNAANALNSRNAARAPCANVPTTSPARDAGRRVVPLPPGLAERVSGSQRPGFVASGGVGGSGADRRAGAGERRMPEILDGALVVPAGAMLRGYLRARSLLLAGDIVGNVHCTAGPVVVRAGATLKGRLVASGDVYIRGRVGDAGGGAVVSTRGKVTLAPGARVDGDIRSGTLDLHDGAMLNGIARAYED